jgi:hypothetical protein
MYVYITVNASILDLFKHPPYPVLVVLKGFLKINNFVSR